LYDQPGVLVLDVTSATFAADLQAALSAHAPYELFAATGNFVILVRGYNG
jgi:hypothetical protein